MNKNLAFGFNDEELAFVGIEKLRMRFQNKINPDEYCLSYSGGKDSHLLYWFIKEVLNDKSILIVSVNTYREHAEIRNRMYKNANVILYPLLKMEEIKECYGMPCFTKRQDDMISRYQRGSRCPHTMSWIYPTRETKYKLNETAKTMLLNDALPKISPECCELTKKAPLKRFQRRYNLKPIIGVRGGREYFKEKLSNLLK